MKTIGLTGGMGAGKSYVASIFKIMGIPVYDSDFEAKRLMNDDPLVRNQIITLLGSDAYDSSNVLDTVFVAQQIFNDNDKLENINGIVHPAVRKDFSEFASKQINSHFVINEAALFVENGNYKDFDYLITVVSPLPLRLKRLKLRDDRPEEEIMLRINKQSSDEEKIAKSDYIIYNDCFKDLFQQISAIHKVVGK